MRAAVAPSPGPHQQDILRLGLGRLVGEVRMMYCSGVGLFLSTILPQLVCATGHACTAECERMVTGVGLGDCM